MFTELVGTLFAGIGLFFIGIKLIGSHLKQMTGSSFRRRIAWAVHDRRRGAMVGVLFGAITQSSSAVTFIITSMVAAGLVTVRKAMPVVTWSNLGTSALVLVATVDFRLGVFLLLGMVGIALYFDIDRSNRFRHGAEAMLGISLLFLGLHFLKSEAIPLRGMLESNSWVAMAANSWILLLLAAAGVTFAIQSSTAVSVIAVAMTKVGLLSMDQTIAVIYGSGVGSAVSLWVMTSNLFGESRQLAIQQILQRFVAAAILFLLLISEAVFGIPGVKALVTLITSDIGMQAAWVYVLYQLVGCAAMTIFSGSIYKLMLRWSPQSRLDELATPKYLYEQALDDTETAMDLVEKEQLRLLRFLPDYLSLADQSNASAESTPKATVLAANRAVAIQLEHFSTELMDRNQDREALRRMLSLQTQTRLLDDLRENLYQFDERLRAACAVDAESESVRNMVAGLVEPIQFLLLILIDAAASRDPAELAQLRLLTDDRSDMMDATRRKLMHSEKGADSRAYEQFFAATSLFERLVWLVRQYGQLLHAADASGTLHAPEVSG